MRRPGRNDEVADLERIPIFRGLRPDELERLASLGGRGRVQANTNLMGLEQPGEVVYMILSGTVRVQIEQVDGTTVILGFLGSGDIVGEMGVLEGEGRSATVVATEPCEYLWFDRDAFRNALESNPKVAMNLLRVMSRRLRLANDRVQIMARLDVSGRVAHQLLSFASQFGARREDGTVQIPLRLTQSDLASVVGASRERVNQVMMELRERDLIAVDSRHRVTIADPDKLQRLYVY